MILILLEINFCRLNDDIKKTTFSRYKMGNLTNFHLYKIKQDMNEDSFVFLVDLFKNEKNMFLDG